MSSPLHQFMQANFPQTSPLHDFLCNNNATNFEAEDVSSVLKLEIMRDDAIVQCKESSTIIVVATKRTKSKKLSRRRQSKSNRKQHSPPPPKSRKSSQGQKNRWALDVSPMLPSTAKSAVPKRPQRLQSMECLCQLPVLESSAAHTSTNCQESRLKLHQRLERMESFSAKTAEATGDDRPQRPSRFASIEMLPQIVSDDRPQRPSRYASIEMLPRATDASVDKPHWKANMQFSTHTSHKHNTSGGRHQEKNCFALSA